MTPARRWLLLVLVGAMVLLAGALLVLRRTDDPDTSTAAPTTTVVPAVLPLLGTPGEPPARAALAVKIDATDNGRPQTGLREADIVFEDVVEGSLTRLLAVVHSQDPDEVGCQMPIAATDRKAPYNLFADTTGLRTAVDTGAPPPMLFAYRATGEPLTGAGVRPARGFRSSTLATSIGWSWNQRTELWERSQNGTPHVDSEGELVAVPNVVVRTTTYRDSGVRDSTGAVVPEAVAVGRGDAWLLSDGKAQPARWSKDATDATTRYTTTDGRPVRLTPGQTWVEILPPGSGEVT